MKAPPYSFGGHPGYTLSRSRLIAQESFMQRYQQENGKIIEVIREQRQKEREEKEKIDRVMSLGAETSRKAEAASTFDKMENLKMKYTR